MHANPVNNIDPSGNAVWIGIGNIGFWLTAALIIKTIAVFAVAVLLYLAWRFLGSPLVMMANSEPMPQDNIDGAVQQMQLYWSNNAKMMNLANGLSGDSPIYRFRMLPPESYSEGLHFLGNMYVNQNTVENQSALAVALILFAEFQHHSAGGGLGEEEAQVEFIAVRNQLPDEVRTDYINNLHHGGTQNE